MKRILVSVLSLCAAYFISAQTTFYIQNGSTISKVENRNPQQIKATEWRIRLYRKGTPKIGNSYWGIIKGSTYNEVMKKLKSDQEFELRFNAFIGKGRVQNDVLTNFNPLGPIAIMDEASQEQPSPAEESLAQVSDLTEKAKDYLNTYAEVKKKLDVILKGKLATPFDNYGSVFREYTENLKDAFKQISSLKNMLKKNTVDLTERINENIETITAKLDAANANQQQLTEAINSTAQKQSTTNTINATSTKGSKEMLIANVPNKFQNSILRVINAGSEISNLKNSVPDELIQGMNAQQKIYFQQFVNHIYSYTRSMAYCFALLSEGSIGYGYLNSNRVVIDAADQYYRDYVLRNDDILKTNNYNSYYSDALLSKANAAYALFKLVESEPNSSKQTKNNLLNYGIANLNMIYQQSIAGYQDESILKEKQELMTKLKQSLK